MVTSAVDMAVLVEVDEVDEQLAAGGTLEALRVPACAVSRTRGKHGYITSINLPSTLKRNRKQNKSVKFNGCFIL